MSEQPQRRGPGRPPGAKSKQPTLVKLERVRDSAPQPSALPDVSEMIGDQLRLIKSAQSRISKDLASGAAPFRAIAEVSTALQRAMDAVGRASRVQEAILARLSLAQHLEAAIRRIEDQPVEVINYTIRRLKRAAEGAPEPRGEAATATEAIASLDEP